METIERRRFTNDEKKILVEEFLHEQQAEQGTTLTAYAESKKVSLYLQLDTVFLTIFTVDRNYYFPWLDEATCGWQVGKSDHAFQHKAYKSQEKGNL